MVAGADHLGHVAAAAGAQLHVARLEAEAARLVHQEVAGLAPALAASAVVRSAEAVADLVTEGQGRDPLRHLEVVTAEGDHACVEAPVDVRRILIMDVEPMLVTDAAISGGGSPCEADGSPREVPEGEEVGQAVIIMVDGGEGVKKSLKTFSHTQISFFKCAACLFQDLKKCC